MFHCPRLFSLSSCEERHDLGHRRKLMLTLCHGPKKSRIMRQGTSGDCVLLMLAAERRNVYSYQGKKMLYLRTSGMFSVCWDVPSSSCEIRWRPSSL
jgi:hypothetical protein